MKICGLTIIAFATLLGLTSPARAADAGITVQEPAGAKDVPDYLRPSSDTETFKIDKKEYRKDQAIIGFLQAAINKSMWEDISFSNLQVNYIPGISPEDSFYNPDYIQKHYPWAYPLIFPINELPDYMAISKWKKSIRISLGLPNGSKPYNVPLYNGKPVTEDPKWPNVLIKNKMGFSELVFKGALLHTGEPPSRKAEAQKIVTDEAALIAPEMARLTGLNVSFITDEPEDSESVSNMRIILISQPYSGWLSKFKRGPFRTVGLGTRLKRAASVSMRDMADHKGIHFTSRYGIYQVDGFFIDNAKNEIEFSVCYIQEDFEADLLKKLVRECLIRSLGLPDLQATFKQSYTYAWNGQAKDKKERDSIPNALKELIGEEETETLLFSNAAFLFYRAEPIEGLITDTASFNDADNYLIRTLYSDAIKPGMNYLEAYEALMKAD